MSNPLRPPQTVILGARSCFPDAFFEPGPSFVKRRDEGKAVGVLRGRLAGLDMELRGSVVVPKAFSVDPRVLTATKPPLAIADTGKISFRVRSGPARMVANAIWDKMPDWGLGGREAAEKKIRTTFFVSGGTEQTLGRLAYAYPRVGARIAAPVSVQEARQAAQTAGLSLDHLPDHALAPYPLVAEQGARSVSINPHSDNGFPVLGRWDTPGASEKVLGLAAAVRKELVLAARTRRGVAEWKTKAEEERPWLVTCRGKAKADYYSSTKIEEGKMRFYNVLPRQIMLNMQVATQPLEFLSRHVLEGSTSGIGLSLVHGGADALVTELDRRMDEMGEAYVHVGDDSWVAVRTGDNVVMFALDCSNFDLTQHADATAEIHREIWRQLRRIDAPAADLWYEYARGRQVVVAGALTYFFKHAGPSGMPLQSKVNDLLMEVLVRRALDRGCAWESESAVDALLTSVGRELGFEVRVEQHSCVRARSIREALEQNPFLFIGYYFHVRGGVVLPCADIPRMLAQLPYPSLKWMKTDRELAQVEAMRLGSIYMSSGIPPREWEEAHRAFRDGAVELLRHTLDTAGDCEDERLRATVGEVAVGPAAVSSLSGLLAAVERDPWELWAEQKLLPSTSTFVALDWAGMVEEEEEEQVRQKEKYLPPPGVAVSATPLPVGRAPTHPVTLANHGRPPPTVVWGPPKAPRQRDEPAAHVRGRPRARRGRVLEEESEEEWWSDSSE